MAPTVVVIGDQDDETVQAAANLLANQIPQPTYRANGWRRSFT
ncbi:MAG: hypothetical protein R2932_30805 [Caldilineaceae bacterium]